MFRYNDSNYSIEDEKRGLLVTQTGGPGFGVYAGRMTSTRGDGSFRFLVHRNETGTGNVKLTLNVNPPDDEWNRPERPADLAREAAVARETSLYKTEPERIAIN